MSIDNSVQGVVAYYNGNRVVEVMDVPPPFKTEKDLRDFFTLVKNKKDAV